MSGDGKHCVREELTVAIEGVLDRHSGSCLDNEPERTEITVALVEELKHWFRLRRRAGRGSRC